MAVAVSDAFIGRGNELVRLLAALERAEQGSPGLMLVVGEAGVGKSRLLTELAAQARRRGVQVLVGGCLEVSDFGLPYIPIISALRSVGSAGGGGQLLRSVAKGLSGLGLLLPELAEEPAVATVGERFDQLQLFDAVRSLLVRLSERAAVVLVLEDLHWADPSTRELISYLHRTLVAGRLLIVGSYRSDDLHRRHPLRPWLAESFRQREVECIELAPFSRAELAEHLAVGRHEPLSAAVMDRIFSRSEGNPFYAEELLAAGADQATVHLPSRLAEILLSRIEALSDATQQVLRVAAVAGRQVRHELLTRAAGLSDPGLEQALRDAIGARILLADAEQGTYRFRHTLIQEALYGELLPGERVRLHADFARLLAADGDTTDADGMSGRAAELAYHCRASHDRAGALAALVRAAAEAEAVAAPAETLRHLEQALSLWQRVPDAATLAHADRTDLLLRAAAAGSDAGDRERAIELTQEAVKRIDAAVNPLQAAAALERLGHYLIDMHRQEFDEALQACRSAAKLAPAHPPTQLRARVTSTFAKVLKDAGRYEEAWRYCEEARVVAGAVGSADEEAEALGVLAMLEEREGRLDEACDLYAEALNRAAYAHDARVRLTVIFDQAYSKQLRGELTEALDLLDEGVNHAWQVGRAWSQPGVMLRGWQCRVHYMLGNWKLSEDLAATFDVVVATPVQARLSVLALPVEVGLGNKRAAERLKWIKMLDRDLSVLVGVASFGAELACWQGDLDTARDLIQDALLAYRSVGSHVTVPIIMLCPFGLAAEADRAEWARASGAADQVADARQAGLTLLEKARAAARGTLEFGTLEDLTRLKAGMVKAEAEWTRLEGHSDPDAWRAAVAAYSFGHLYEVARCQWRLAEALLGVGDREQATVAARAAYQTAAELGAEPLRGALDALARRSRLDLGQGLPHKPGRAGLTPRELEVLRLLMAGHSNRQIAEQLFISGKTASVHVTRILAKLGVHSRRDAAVLARQLGLDRTLDNG